MFDLKLLVSFIVVFGAGAASAEPREIDADIY
jgi:hypothetical protein